MAPAQSVIYLFIGDKVKTATLVDNQATRSLISLLKDGSITITMEDYGGFEKVGSLPHSLPTSNSRISTAPGDIMLYQGDNIVVFYGSNSWSYTRLGKINDATQSDLRDFLGSGSVVMTLALSAPAGINAPVAAYEKDETIYNLQGRLVTRQPPSPGLYIINGKKTRIK